MSRQHVYFIRPVGMEGPVKVGCSKSPDGRRATLETWSPFALEIIAQIEGDTVLERRFHALFEEYHERREWFRWSARIAEVVTAINAGTFDVSSLPPPASVVHKGRRWSDISRRNASYSHRICRMTARTGHSFPRRVWGMIARGDAETIAAAEAYLSDPLAHGEPIDAPWAREAAAKYRLQSQQDAAA